MPARLPDEVRRSKYVGFRLTGWQYGVLERAAAIEEITVGELVTRHVEQYVAGLELAERTGEPYQTVWTFDDYVSWLQSSLRRVAHNMEDIKKMHAEVERQERVKLVK